MNKKGLLLALSTAIISGVSIYINKFGVAVGSPVVFAFLKNSLVALALLVVILSWKNWREIKELKLKKWLLLLIIGFIGGAVPFILFFKGLALTSAAQGSFIHKTMFLFVAILAIIFLKEKINKYFLGGAILLLLGNLLALKSFSFSFGRGDALILAATLFWAVENIISKHLLRTVKSEIVAGGRMFFGALFILAYIIFIGQGEVIFNLNVKQIGWVMITAAFLLGYVITWYKSLAKIPVSIATSILLLGSPITTLLTIAVAGKVNGNEILSSLFIIFGIVTIIFFSYEKNEEKEIRPVRA